MVYQNCQTVTQDFHCYVAIVITNVFEINVPDYLLPYPYPYRPTLILIALPLSLSPYPYPESIAELQQQFP
jgi:hypothetical protein